MQNLSGLLRVAGAPASAKTTVTSSIFKQWCARNGEYGLTVEQPVEYYMSGMQSFDGKVSKISQIDYAMDAVEPVLSRILRIQARYLMIGEIRSAERKRVAKGKSMSVLVDLSGRRIHKNKNKK